MAEHSLLLHAAFDNASSRFFALGADLPSARVFDLTTGGLVSVVSQPRHASGVSVPSFSRLDESSKLSSLAFGTLSASSKKNAAPSQTKVAAVGCVAGLSNGCIILHNVTNDSCVCHQSISDTQQAIVSIRLQSGFVFCLAKNRLVFVYDVEQAKKRVCSPNMPHGASAIDVAECDGADNIRLVVAGTTIVVFQLKLSATRIGKSSSPISLEKIVSFAAGATPATHVQYCPISKAVVTSNASDGVIRVWDTSSSASTNARCRRSLNCGGSWIVTVRVTESLSGSATADQACSVTATTYDGVCRVWHFESGLLPRGGDSGAPLEAMASLCIPRSTATRGMKVLASDLVARTGKIVVACGTTALPYFESFDLSDVLSKQGGITHVSIHNNASEQQRRGADDDETGADWATHSATALRAAVTPSVAFPAPEMHQDKTVKDLPRPAQSSSVGGAASSSTLGLACVALYQALHAKDYGAVMDLLSATSRSEADMGATVKLLTLPYCLQLLQILSERATVGSVRSPMFHWIAVIIRHKGGELLALEREMSKSPESSTTPTLSRPSVFLAPILHRFSAVTAQFDKIAHLYGRFSVFDDVRPLNRAANGGDHRVSLNSAVFMTTFKEIRSSRNEWGSAVIRLRNSSTKGKKQHKKSSSLLATDFPGEGDDDDDGSLNLDNMRLGGDEGDEADVPDAKQRSKKKRRKEMIVDPLGFADDQEGGEGDAELFAESSDDDIGSGADAESSSEEGEEGEEEEYDGYADEEVDEVGPPSDDDVDGLDDDDDALDDGDDDELQAEARDPAQRPARV